VLSADVRPDLIAALESARTDSSDVRQVGQQVVAKSRSAGRLPKTFNDAAILGSACRPIGGVRHG
jgi:hypothetical protein